MLYILRERNELAIDELIFNDIELGDFDQLSKDVL